MTGQNLGGGAAIGIDAAISALAPASYWKLGEATGSLADSVPSGIAGTYVSGTRAAKGPPGSRAVDISSLNTAVATFGTTNYEFLNKSPFTVVLLHYTTQTSDGSTRRLFAKEGATLAGWGLYVFSGIPGFARGWGTGVTVNAPNAYSLNTWNIYAATYDGSTLGVYCNGLMNTGADATNNVTSSANALRLNGSTADLVGVSGRYGPTAVWNRALSQAELDSIYTFV